MPSGSFTLNGGILLSPGIDLGYSSFQSVIGEIRDLGYASNQVYYLCHSMGGSVLRQAIEVYPDRFSSNDPSNPSMPYSNYGKGYVNKAITLNTPHNSSELADMLAGFLPSINDPGIVNTVARNALYAYYGQNPNNFFFNLFQPDNGPQFSLTPAVEDLRVDETKGGVNFPITNVPTHLICGDIVPGAADPPNIPTELYDLINTMQDIVNFWDKLYDHFAANYNGVDIDIDAVKALKNLNQADRVLRFIERLMDSYTATDFIMNSDIIVPVQSQIAGQNRTDPNVSVFDNVGHAVYNAVTESNAVGDRVNDLLHTSNTSTEFASIQATPNKTAVVLPSIEDDMNMPTSNHANGIAVLEPITNSTVYVDSSLNIQVHLVDTVDLEYVKIYFQNEVYMFPDITDTLINVIIQIQGNFLDTQRLEVVAMYNYNNDSTAVANKELDLNILTTQPIQEFIVSPEVNYIFIDQIIIPEYRAIYTTFLSKIGHNNANITATVANPAIVSFDDNLKSFKGIQLGNTYATVTFNGKTDTIYFIVGSQPDTTTQTNVQQNEFLESRGEIKIYPNPTSGLTTIEYEITEPSSVFLQVYDLSGQLIEQETKIEKQSGKHTIIVNMTNYQTGLYLICVQIGDRVSSETMIKVK